MMQRNISKLKLYRQSDRVSDGGRDGPSPPPRILNVFKRKEMLMKIGDHETMMGVMVMRCGLRRYMIFYRFEGPTCSKWMVSHHNSAGPHADAE